MNDDDAPRLTVGDALESALLAEKPDLAFVVTVRITPLKTFISVDLPAPFSPTMA